MRASRMPQPANGPDCWKRWPPPNRLKLNPPPRQQQAGANAEKGQPAMINFKTKLWVSLTTLLITLSAGAQQQSPSPAGSPADKSHANCPMMQPDQATDSSPAHGHATHLDEVNARGEKAMGFSQTATTHHFL